MFREMRRKRQLLSESECRRVLERGTSGVLAVSGDMGYPYAVPLSYVFDGEKIYFHGAKNGHKVDAVRRDAKASFCVIDQDQVIPEEYTTYFRSVIAFGTVRILEDEKEKWAAAEKLALRYHPTDTKENRENAIEREFPPLCMMEFTIEHMTGKEAVELVRRREAGEKEAKTAETEMPANAAETAGEARKTPGEAINAQETAGEA